MKFHIAGDSWEVELVERCVCVWINVCGNIKCFDTCEEEKHITKRTAYIFI